MKFKMNKKTIRCLYIGAAVVFAVLIGLLIFLLRSSPESSPEPGEIPEVTETPLPETGPVIGGRRVEPDADTFFLRNTELNEEDLEKLASLHSLETLSLTGCSLTELRFLSEMPELTTLYLSDNSIFDLSPLSSLTRLRTVYLDRNPVTDLSPLRSLSSLSTISLKGVSVSAYELSALRSALPRCSIFDDGAVDGARPISLGGLDFTEDDTVLDLGWRGVTDITKLADCSDLEELSLAGNPLDGVGVLPQLTKLKRLDLSSTGMQDSWLRVLMGMRQLEFLDIRGNGDITAESLARLKEALPRCSVLHDNVAYKLNLAGNVYVSSITTLSVTDAGISSLTGLEKFALLDTVDLSRNRISDVRPLGYAPHMKTLCLEQNRIETTEGLSSLKELEWLDLSDNSITDITALAGCTSLKWLDLSNNYLTYVSHLALCSQLEYLDLRGNFMLTWDALEYLRAILPSCEILTDVVEPTPEPTPIPTMPPLDVPPPMETEPPVQEQPAEQTPAEQTPAEQTPAGDGEIIPVF